MTSHSMIQIASIENEGRLRSVDPQWVNFLAEDIAVNGLIEPIRVVARGNGYKLVDGARRIAAHLKLGWPEIEAQVEPEEALADDTAVRLAEIKGHMLRGALVALDHAICVATWCDIYQAIHGQPKRGRKPSRNAASDTDEALHEKSAESCTNWSEAAQGALGLSRRALFYALKIARLSPEIRVRIATHPVADNQRELLLLAELTPVRQTAVVDILTDDEPQATSVAEAIALLDSVPAPRPVPAYERVFERFAKLRAADQEKFFELNVDAIEVWMARRAEKARKAA